MLPGASQSLRRLLGAFAVLLLVVAAGSCGFHALGAGRWTFAECVYMTGITITTVGFGELNDMHTVPYARGLTVALIITGVGAIAFVQGNITAVLVEGVIGHALRRSRMQKKVSALKNHIVVAGSGSTGKHVIEELVATRTPFVVIDTDREHLERISAQMQLGAMLFVHGDATLDHVLLEAGIDRARGVVAALTHDKDNLYVTLSARSLNPTARIVTKVTEDEAAPKMLKAGATSVVSPTMIGGRRMASDLIRPQVNDFLDQMLRDKDKNLRLEEVAIPEGSPFAGHALRDAPIRKETGLLVVALRDAGHAFVYNPDPRRTLAAGETLIVLGDATGVSRLRELVSVKE